MNNHRQTAASRARALRPGRNDPCRCGSGIKYKKCCGRALVNESRYDVMKRIAYVSDIGRRREAFCLDMTERMQAYHREAMACLGEKARTLGLTITCRKGCPHCCSQYIWTSLQEAEAIVYYLYHNPEALELFVSRYQTWKTWPGRAAADQAVSHAFASNQDAPFEEALEVYLGLENPCPFLAEGTCAIYPVRPISCASIASFSPASCCRASSEQAPLCGMAPAILPSDYPPYLGRYHILPWGGMPQMVNRLLSGGYVFLLDVVDSEELREEAWSDPVLSGALGKYRDAG